MLTREQIEQMRRDFEEGLPTPYALRIALCDLALSALRESGTAQGFVSVPRSDIEKAIARMESNGMSDWKECKALKAMLAAKQSGVDHE